MQRNNILDLFLIRLVESTLRQSQDVGKLLESSKNRKSFIIIEESD